MRLAVPGYLNLRMGTQSGSFAGAYAQKGEKEVKWLRCFSGRVRKELMLPRMMLGGKGVC